MDIPLWSKLVPSVYIHCDCRVVIANASNKTYNGKSKHIRRRHNSVRQLISNGIISIDFVKSQNNLADPLTKRLSRDIIYKTSKEMGLKPNN